MALNKWIVAATEYGLWLEWRASDRYGLALYAMTVIAENGGHRYRKLITAQRIEEALKISIEIYEHNGRLDASDLVDDVWWQYGWDPETMADLRAKVRDASANPKWRDVNWFGWWNWKKEGAKHAPPASLPGAAVE